MSGSTAGGFDLFLLKFPRQPLDTLSSPSFISLMQATSFLWFAVAA
jgi:hypothetical protein